MFTLGDSAALAADAFGDGAEKFFDANELAQHIKPMIAPGITVLIKGSRVNRLERVVDAIAAQPNERS
jgi:UDP-N-acetylmuramoyl-tripeptide--D-alanyl-D-alanine ligase